VVDNTGDYGIRDTATGLIADYLTGTRDRSLDTVRSDLERLNAGTLDPLVITTGAFAVADGWHPEGDLYPPYEEVTA
jgi:hypothetical protein